jgi:hypothetical protein
VRCIFVEPHKGAKGDGELNIFASAEGVEAEVVFKASDDDGKA